MSGEVAFADEEAEAVTQALQLLDFDWKLKYVVSSASSAIVNRPLLRLELVVSTAPVQVEDVPYFRKESVDEEAQSSVAEYNKTELDNLILEMENISQVGYTSLVLFSVSNQQLHHRQNISLIDMRILKLLFTVIVFYL